MFVRLTRYFYPVTGQFHGSRFFVKLDGRPVTPLFLALVLVESSDVMFAVDSIPAVFAVTRDPFIVFTSNIFAILGGQAEEAVLLNERMSLHTNALKNLRWTQPPSGKRSYMNSRK